MPLRVAFDISELGSDHHRPENRRGVNRVVEEVGNSLARLVRDKADAVELLAVGVQSSAAAAAYLDSPRAGLLASAGRLDKPAHRRWTAVEERSLTLVADTANRGLARRASRWLIARSLPAQRRIASRLRAFDPESVDVFHSTAVNPFPAYVLRARRPACVTTLYDLIPVRRPELVAPASIANLRAMLATFRREHFGICISQHVKDDFCEYLRLDPSHLFVAPLAADPTRFHPCTDTAEIAAARQRFLPDAEQPYFLSLCTVERRKNLLQLIRCFAQLKREDPAARDTRLVLVGHVLEAARQQVEANIAAEKLEGQVILTGYVADGHLAPIYSGALAFVFPSLAEGFGLPPLEAMQCGVPVICSDRTSLPEVVGDAGLLFNPDDADTLCAAMSQVLREDTLRSDLARRGLARASLFSWERCAQDHLAAYRAAVHLKGDPSSC
ncbi:MAG: glycosyltransferase family 4 protein [Rhodospirillales bacterium]|nr:glycosyltransferase family 4 protein [Acetobacter sp.]